MISEAGILYYKIKHEKIHYLCIAIICYIVYIICMHVCSLEIEVPRTLAHCILEQNTFQGLLSTGYNNRVSMRQRLTAR